MSDRQPLIHAKVFCVECLREMGPVVVQEVTDSTVSVIAKPCDCSDRPPKVYASDPKLQAMAERFIAQRRGVR